MIDGGRMDGGGMDGGRMNGDRKKRVYIAYTGGTIGMQPSERGYLPVEAAFKKQLLAFIQAHQADLPDVDVYEYPELIDSANVTPLHWKQISDDIASRYHEFDGFVVLHGTDTMAYTASALSFMLEDLSKPVIVTGSQIPWSQVRSDAQDNLLTSILLAANYDIPEVGLYFHNHLYRGNRSRKVDASGFHAFESPNCAPLATVGTRISINTGLLLEKRPLPLKVHKLVPPNVAVLMLFPGFPPNLLGHVLEGGAEGVVLMTYGMGNVPSQDKEFLGLLSQASARGVVIVNCSQCYKGRVDMAGYETGKVLMECGAVSAMDMTPEATLTKLSFLLSTNLPVEEVRTKMQRNLRGELTP